MSYGAAAALQAAVWQRLAAQAEFVGIPIVDAIPAGQAPEVYVLIGPEDVRDASDRTGSGAEHRFTVSVVSRQAGFAAAKLVASRISDVLEGGGMLMTRGRLVGLWFVQAVARRLDNGAVRRIDMTFRARVELD